jgi:AraC family L-rhamnose operon regulatory protein RhaS
MDANFRRRPILVSLPDYGVFMLESYHGPGFLMKEEQHDFLEVFYVLSGSGTFHIEGSPHRCDRADVVVVPPGRRHRIEDDPTGPLALYGICVRPQVWGREPLLDELPAGRLPVNTLLAGQVRGDLRRLIYEQTLARPGSRALIVGQALQLLVTLARSRQGPAHAEKDLAASGCRQTVQRYVAELPHRFFEAHNLDQTAGELGMSRRRFTHLFRELTRTSWSAYLTRLRIDHACMLLRDTGRGIAAVAFECGFEDLSSFYRAFKRHTGQPPHAWRQGQA